MIKPIEYTYDEEGNKVIKKVKINNTIYICEPPGVISLDNHPDLIQKILKLKLSEIPKGLTFSSMDNSTIETIVREIIEHIYGDMYLDISNSGTSLSIVTPNTKYDLQEKPYSRKQYLEDLAEIAKILNIKHRISYGTADYESDAITFLISPQETVEKSLMTLKELINAVKNLGISVEGKVITEFKNLINIKPKPWTISQKIKPPKATMKILKKKKRTYNNFEEVIIEEIEINGKKYRGIENSFTIPYDEVKNLHLGDIPSPEIEITIKNLHRAVPTLEKLWGTLDVEVSLNEITVEYILYRIVPIDVGPYTIEDHCKILETCLAPRLGFRPGSRDSMWSCSFEKNVSDYLCNVIEHVRLLAKAIEYCERKIENAVKRGRKEFLKKFRSIKTL